jgi:hypothetical protein
MWVAVAHKRLLETGQLFDLSRPFVANFVWRISFIDSHEALLFWKDPRQHCYFGRNPR